MAQMIQLAPREKLLSLDAIDGLALFLTTLPASRRDVPDLLAERIFAFVEGGGVVLDGEGFELVIGDSMIDDAHGNDGSFAWVSAVRRRAGRLAQRKPRQTMLMRMQVYDLAARIMTGQSIIGFSHEGEKA